MGIFENIKVIDFTHAYSGPFCSMNLADQGAEVIKIERPDGGDQARTWGPFKNNYSAYYASFNRGKKSMTLNIATEEGQKIISQLVRGADIVCSNFKAGTLEKYGIGYEQMRKVKPDIIYATLSGFGTKGPLSRFAAYDNVMQATSGIMDMNGFPDKGPTKIGPAIGDSYSGLMLLIGLAIAYYHRLKTGQGQQVDTTMLGSLYTMLEFPVLEYANNGVCMTRGGNTSPYYAPGDCYPVKDGFFALSVKNDAMWRAFCGALGLDPEGPDGIFATNALRLAHRQELDAVLLPIFSRCTKKELENLMGEAQVPGAAVMGIEAALRDPHLLARDMVITVDDPALGDLKLVGNPIRLSESRANVSRPSPTLGQHTEAILTEMGYSSGEIAALRQKGVI